MIDILNKFSIKLLTNDMLRYAFIVYATFGFGVFILMSLMWFNFNDIAYIFAKFVVYYTIFIGVLVFGSLMVKCIKDIRKPVSYSDENEIRFYVAKEKADKMTLSQLTDISNDFNVGYDVTEKMFEVMVKIPIEELEK